ncbi:class A beta-lactamase [Allofrancisella guangzhouensis]|uniref:Beta-lactamase n=1 Tax=Allofrancisella guangzhouensis TaxID=594679 RepID=A0A0A8E6P4_9GAMM|nr:class A beta-lactamase [Allofrancisella guangzhouensis]AJC49272.1 beta-lactamase [Allofrancisella guangzhouensis]MBK2027717.1 class A beta-lactamase [Allofrancisella guangzhouensis]MBK2044010.1 class A beta-lactamase [Allofrancisella guangzhouensis]MBK2046394.1 class A beta-lactamase [Allofrancisella guangzhouensis]
MKKLIIILANLLHSVVFATLNNVETSEQIKKLEIKYGGKIGIYLIDYNNKSHFGYNQNFYFPICSVYKFLVVGAILKESMITPNFLNEKIKINKNDIIGYTPITSENIDKKLTIEELSKAAILSDNTAANLLIKKLGGLKNLNKFIWSLDDKDTKITVNEPTINNVDLRDSLNKTTPQIIAKDLNKIAFEKKVLNKKYQLIFKKWLQENDTGKNRIAFSIPKEWKVGDKTGTCEYGTTNDVAIIWPKNKKPIIISVLYTQVNKNAKANDIVIQKITKILLDNLEYKNND